MVGIGGSEIMCEYCRLQEARDILADVGAITIFIPCEVHIPPLRALIVRLGTQPDTTVHTKFHYSQLPLISATP